jgi:hypothetical protein
VNTEADDNIGIRHQATTGEDIGDSDDLVRAVGKCKMCELAIAL